MCQHNSFNNDSALISATERLTMCLTTMERTKICESWKHLEMEILPGRQPRMASLFVSPMGEVL
jgi:hypothetical protein